MTVIHRPDPAHACNPGWRWQESTGEGIGAPPAGSRYGIPPDPWDFPPGTIWACDCGRTWVSTGSPAPFMPGFCGWRREGRIERWRRERRAKQVRP